MRIHGEKRSVTVHLKFIAAVTVLIFSFTSTVSYSDASLIASSIQKYRSSSAHQRSFANTVKNRAELRRMLGMQPEILPKYLQPNSHSELRAELRARQSNLPSPESLAESYQQRGYSATLDLFNLGPRSYHYIMSGYITFQGARSVDYFALTYDEARKVIQKPRARKPYGVLNSKQTAQNLILATLDTIRGFKRARERGDIKRMANLYRRYVIRYKPKNRKRYKFDSQLTFFRETGGLDGLMTNTYSYLPKKLSPGVLLRLILPELIDVRNPDALDPLEVERSYWTESENAKYHILLALDAIPGFKKARKHNDIKRMANLYRKYVNSYKSRDKEKFPSNGQLVFFYERGGLLTLIKHPRPYFRKRESPAELLRLAIPELVNPANPNALKPQEIEKSRTELRMDKTVSNLEVIQLPQMERRSEEQPNIMGNYYVKYGNEKDFERLRQDARQLNLEPILMISPFQKRGFFWGRGWRYMDEGNGEDEYPHRVFISFNWYERAFEHLKVAIDSNIPHPGANAISFALSKLDLNGKVLLDAGTGDGILAIQAAKSGAKVIAIDWNRDVIRLARQNAKLNRVDNRIKFFSGNYTTMTIQESASVDMIMINHSTLGLQSHLASLLLKYPNAKIVIVAGGYATETERASGDILNGFDAKEIDKELQDNGYKPEKLFLSPDRRNIGVNIDWYWWAFLATKDSSNASSMIPHPSSIGISRAELRRMLGLAPEILPKYLRENYRSELRRPETLFDDISLDHNLKAVMNQISAKPEFLHGDRKVVLRRYIAHQSAISERDWVRVREKLMKNETQKYESKNDLINLKDPFVNQYGELITAVQLKRVSFNERSYLRMHVGEGYAPHHFSVTQDGRYVLQEHPPSPEGAMVANAALREFVNTHLLYQDVIFNQSAHVKTPLAIGLFPNAEFRDESVGFVMLGVSEKARLRVRDGTNFLKMTEMWGKALRVMHERGFIHFFLHSENLSIGEFPTIHDLDPAKNRQLDQLSDAQFLGLQFGDLDYALHKVVMLHAMKDPYLAIEGWKHFLIGYFGADVAKEIDLTSHVFEETSSIMNLRSGQDFLVLNRPVSFDPNGVIYRILQLNNRIAREPDALDSESYLREIEAIASSHRSELRVKKGKTGETYQEKSEFRITRRKSFWWLLSGVTLVGLGGLVAWGIRIHSQRTKERLAQIRKKWASSNHQIQPTLESAKKSVLIAIEYLKANDYPDSGVLNRYRQALADATEFDLGEKIFGKTINSQTKKLTVFINSQGVYNLMQVVQAVDSEEYFLETFATLVAREAWGLEIISVSGSDTALTIARAKEILVEEGQKILPTELIQRQNPELSRFLTKYQTEIESFAAVMLALEFYEHKKQFEVLKWATEKGIYSIESVNLGIENKNQKHPTLKAAAVHYRPNFSMHLSPNEMLMIELKDILPYYLPTFLSGQRRNQEQINILGFFTLLQFERYMNTKGTEGLSPRIVDLSVKNMDISPELFRWLSNHMLPKLEEIVRRWEKMRESRSELRQIRAGSGTTSAFERSAQKSAPSFYRLIDEGLGQPSPTINLKSRKVRTELRARKSKRKKVQEINPRATNNDNQTIPLWRRRDVLIGTGLGIGALATGIGIVWRLIASSAPVPKKWYEHDFPETLEGVQSMVHLAIDWLRTHHYPRLDVIERYAEAFKTSEVADSKMLSEAPFAKVRLNTGKIQIWINVPYAHLEFEKARKTQSESFFIENYVATIVQEAWGLEAYRVSGDQDTSFKVNFDLLKSKANEAILKGQNDITSLLKENENLIRQLLAILLAGELFEVKKRTQFLEWAQNQKLYSVERLEQELKPFAKDQSITDSHWIHQEDFQLRNRREMQLAFHMSGLLTTFLRAFTKEGRSDTSLVYTLYYQLEADRFNSTGGKEGIDPKVFQLIQQGILPKTEIFRNVARELAPEVYKLVDEWNQKLRSELRSEAQESRQQKRSGVPRRWVLVGGLALGLVALIGIPVAVHFSVKSDEPWRKFKSEPTLENAKALLHMTIQLTKETVASDEDRKVLDEYAKLVDQAKEVPENRKGDLIYKDFHPDRPGQINIFVNPKLLHGRFSALQELGSQQAFLETFGSMVIREAWGVKVVKLSIEHEFKELDQKVRKIYGEEISRFMSLDKVEWPNQDMSRFLATFDTDLEWMTAVFVSPEYYESIKQYHYAKKIRESGISSADEMKKAYQAGKLSLESKGIIDTMLEELKGLFDADDHPEQLIAEKLKFFIRKNLPIFLSHKWNEGPAAEAVVKTYGLFVFSEFERFVKSRSGINPKIVEVLQQGNIPVAETYRRSAKRLLSHVQKIIQDWEDRDKNRPELRQIRAGSGTASAFERLAQKSAPSFNRFINRGLGLSSPSIDSKSMKVRAELRKSSMSNDQLDVLTDSTTPRRESSRSIFAPSSVPTWLISVFNSWRVSFNSLRVFDSASSNRSVLPSITSKRRSTLSSRLEFPWTSTSTFSSLLSISVWPSAIVLISLWMFSSIVPTSVGVKWSDFWFSLEGFSFFMAALLLNHLWNRFSNVGNEILSGTDYVVNQKSKKIRSELRELTFADEMKIEPELVRKGIVRPVIEAEIIKIFDSSRRQQDFPSDSPLVGYSIYVYKRQNPPAEEDEYSFQINNQATAVVASGVFYCSELRSTPFESSTVQRADQTDRRSELRIPLLEGSIFNRNFIKKEKAISKKIKTIAFDMDGILTDGDKKILRPGIEEQLRILKSNGIRLVLWTAAGKAGPNIFFRNFPQMTPYFDLVITKENYTPNQTEAIWREWLAIHKRVNQRNWHAYHDQYGIFDDGKDVALLGYAMLVDDRPTVIRSVPESPWYGRVTQKPVAFQIEHFHIPEPYLKNPKKYYKEDLQYVNKLAETLLGLLRSELRDNKTIKIKITKKGWWKYLYEQRNLKRAMVIRKYLNLFLKDPDLIQAIQEDIGDSTIRNFRFSIHNLDLKGHHRTVFKLDVQFKINGRVTIKSYSLNVIPAQFGWKSAGLEPEFLEKGLRAESEITKRYSKDDFFVKHFSRALFFKRFQNAIPKKHTSKVGFEDIFFQLRSWQEGETLEQIKKEQSAEETEVLMLRSVILLLEAWFKLNGLGYDAKDLDDILVTNENDIFFIDAGFGKFVSKGDLRPLLINLQELWNWHMRFNPYLGSQKEGHLNFFETLIKEMGSNGYAVLEKLRDDLEEQIKTNGDAYYGLEIDVRLFVSNLRDFLENHSGSLNQAELRAEVKPTRREVVQALSTLALTGVTGLVSSCLQNQNANQPSNYIFDGVLVPPIPDDIPTTPRLVYEREGVHIDILDNYDDSNLQFSADEIKTMFDLLDKIPAAHLQTVHWIAARSDFYSRAGGETRFGGIIAYVKTESKDTTGEKETSRQIFFEHSADYQTEEKQSLTEKATFGNLASGLAHEIGHHVHLLSALLDDKTRNDWRVLHEKSLIDERTSSLYRNFVEGFWFLKPAYYLDHYSAYKKKQMVRFGIPYGVANHTEDFATIYGNWVNNSESFLAEAGERAQSGYPFLLTKVLFIASLFIEGSDIHFYDAQSAATYGVRVTSQSIHLTEQTLQIGNYQFGLDSNRIIQISFPDKVDDIKQINLAPQIDIPLPQIWIDRLAVQSHSELRGKLKDATRKQVKDALLTSELSDKQLQKLDYLVSRILRAVSSPNYQMDKADQARRVLMAILGNQDRITQFMSRFNWGLNQKPLERRFVIDSFPDPSLFTEAEKTLIQKRGRLLAEVYPKLSDEAKKVLLFPSLLLTWMGIKPAYLRYELKNEPDPTILLRELENLPEIWNELNTTFIFNQSGIYSPFDIGANIIRKYDFLRRMNILSPEENLLILQVMSKMVAEPENLEASELALMELAEHFVINMGDFKNVRYDILSGIFLDYPEQDIEAVVHYKTTLKGESAWPGSQWFDTDFKDIGLSSRLDERGQIKPETLRFLKRINLTLYYAYSLIRHHRDFPTLVREIELPNTVHTLSVPTILAASSRAELRSQNEAGINVDRSHAQLHLGLLINHPDVNRALSQLPLEQIAYWKQVLHRPVLQTSARILKVLSNPETSSDHFNAEDLNFISDSPQENGSDKPAQDGLWKFRSLDLKNLINSFGADLFGEPRDIFQKLDLRLKHLEETFAAFYLGDDEKTTLELAFKELRRIFTPAGDYKIIRTASVLQDDEKGSEKGARAFLASYLDKTLYRLYPYVNDGEKFKSFTLWIKLSKIPGPAGLFRRLMKKESHFVLSTYQDLEKGEGRQRIIRPLRYVGYVVSFGLLAIGIFNFALLPLMISLAVFLLARFSRLITRPGYLFGPRTFRVTDAGLVEMLQLENLIRRENAPRFLHGEPPVNPAIGTASFSPEKKLKRFDYEEAEKSLPHYLNLKGLAEQLDRVEEYVSADSNKIRIRFDVYWKNDPEKGRIDLDYYPQDVNREAEAGDVLAWMVAPKGPRNFGLGRTLLWLILARENKWAGHQMIAKDVGESDDGDKLLSKFSDFSWTERINDQDSARAIPHYSEKAERLVTQFVEHEIHWTSKLVNPDNVQEPLRTAAMSELRSSKRPVSSEVPKTLVFGRNAISKPELPLAYSFNKEGQGLLVPSAPPTLLSARAELRGENGGGSALLIQHQSSREQVMRHLRERDPSRIEKHVQYLNRLIEKLRRLESDPLKKLARKVRGLNPQKNDSDFDRYLRNFVREKLENFALQPRPLNSYEKRMLIELIAETVTHELVGVTFVNDREVPALQFSKLNTRKRVLDHIWEKEPKDHILDAVYEINHYIQTLKAEAETDIAFLQKRARDFIHPDFLKRMNRAMEKELQKFGDESKTQFLPDEKQKLIDLLAEVFTYQQIGFEFKSRSRAELRMSSNLFHKMPQTIEESKTDLALAHALSLISMVRITQLVQKGLMIAPVIHVLDDQSLLPDIPSLEDVRKFLSKHKNTIVTFYFDSRGTGTDPITAANLDFFRDDEIARLEDLYIQTVDPSDWWKPAFSATRRILKGSVANFVLKCLNLHEVLQQIPDASRDSTIDDFEAFQGQVLVWELHYDKYPPINQFLVAGDIESAKKRLLFSISGGSRFLAKLEKTEYNELIKHVHHRLEAAKELLKILNSDQAYRLVQAARQLVPKPNKRAIQLIEKLLASASDENKIITIGDDTKRQPFIRDWISNQIHPPKWIRRGFKAWEIESVSETFPWQLEYELRFHVMRRSKLNLNQVAVSLVNLETQTRHIGFFDAPPIAPIGIKMYRAIFKNLPPGRYRLEAGPQTLEDEFGGARAELRKNRTSDIVGRTSKSDVRSAKNAVREKLDSPLDSFDAIDREAYERLDRTIENVKDARMSKDSKTKMNERLAFRNFQRSGEVIQNQIPANATIKVANVFFANAIEEIGPALGDIVEAVGDSEPIICYIDIREIDERAIRELIQDHPYSENVHFVLTNEGAKNLILRVRANRIHFIGVKDTSDERNMKLLAEMLEDERVDIISNKVSNPQQILDIFGIASKIAAAWKYNFSFVKSA